MRAKGERRVHVGPHLTFLFENHETIHYQVQEMTRAERMVKEADIVHEIETYNELLGGPGEVGCTLLVELDDPAARAEKLTKWLALPKHLYAKRADGPEGLRPLRRAAGGRDARVVGPVPQVRGGPEGPGRDRLRPPGPGAPPRDDADATPSAPPCSATWTQSRPAGGAISGRPPSRAPACSSSSTSERPSAATYAPSRRSPPTPSCSARRRLRGHVRDAALLGERLGLGPRPGSSPGSWAPSCRACPATWRRRRPSRSA